MITSGQAGKQILRLSGLANFPKERTAQEELADALARFSRDAEHAARTVTQWLESSRYAPTVFDLREMAASTDGEVPEESTSCLICGDTGWEYVEASRGVRNCSCKRGQARVEGRAS